MAARAAAGLVVPALEIRYTPQLFNEIRLVKTPREIELMTLAARANETALLASAAALRDGITWDELENVYRTEMLRQGARGVYRACGVGELPHGRIRVGEAGDVRRAWPRVPLPRGLWKAPPASPRMAATGWAWRTSASGSCSLAESGYQKGFSLPRKATASTST